MTVAVKEKPVLEVVPASPKRLPRTAMKEAQHCRQSFWAKVPPGVTQDDCRSPHFLALLASRLHRHDLIWLLADDESWELELCVEKVLIGEVHVSVRKVYGREALSLVSVPVDDAGEFRAEYVGGRGWCVVRRSDGHPVLAGYSDASSAVSDWRKRQPRPVLS